MVATYDEPEADDPNWNVESENLKFIKEEGLELLRLFRLISNRRQRNIVMDLVRAIAGEELGPQN